jgi:hypothetical protein
MHISSRSSKALPCHSSCLGGGIDVNNHEVSLSVEFEASFDICDELVRSYSHVEILIASLGFLTLMQASLGMFYHAPVLECPPKNYSEVEACYK